MYKCFGSRIIKPMRNYVDKKKHDIKGSSRHKHFLQRICATSIGTSIPLIYPESTMFPSIFWKMANDHCSICGAIPSSLLTDQIRRLGFQSLLQHV